MAGQVVRAQALIARLSGYHFTNEKLLLEALDTTGMRCKESNQRLALLGDAKLRGLLLEDWYASRKTKCISSTSVKQSARTETGVARVRFQNRLNGR